ncbi:MAG TPA: thioredoxin family protein [Rariglobus sp.]|jgi:protein disulfide-isomerase|nr:thioredoxin family protein [Rariglobus sp.]
MKRILGFIALVFFTLSLHAADDAWLTDYAAAARKASVEHKPMLLDFTGSDWCGWCMKLDREVFSRPEFVSYAKTNLILVKVDFPRDKPQSAAEKHQNEKLAAKYKIEGYPTIVVLNEHGTQIGELGYEEGGAKVWIASLEKVTKKKP